MVESTAVGMNIKNAETELLTRRLAEATGESLTTAITVAVRERLDRLRVDSADEAERKRQRLRQIAEDAAPRWRDDLRDRDHGDLLYDERGLPR
jgi:antitoxin VapB